jgi:hypothetical protein
MTYRELNPDYITRTLDKLHARVAERFPTRGLLKVCAELRDISSTHVERANEASSPRKGLRVLVGLVLAVGISAIIWGVVQKVRLLTASTDELYSFEGVEAIANMVILVGAGTWFLLNLETRIKRERALQNLHQLRSIAHVIDMHQLTKDPTSVLKAGATKSSPKRDLSPYELMRYLDYCTEMLSLTGKLAALYMQGLRDPVVIQAVNEIEELTTNLSRKMWQKIMILRSAIDAAELANIATRGESGALTTLTQTKKTLKESTQ